jgi:hypothetical protein
MVSIAARDIGMAPGSGAASANGKDCAHDETSTSHTSGLERVVCQGCGHVSVRFVAAVCGSVDRARFARPADTVP